MIIDAATAGADQAEAYDRRGKKMGFLVLVNTDTMEGQQVAYWNPGPPPIMKTRPVKVWTLIWNGMRFERNRRGRVGKVFNTGRKTP